MKSRVNFLSSYTATNKLINTDFLGTKIGLNQYLYINNKTNLRQEYLKLILGIRNILYQLQKNTIIQILNQVLITKN